MAGGDLHSRAFFYSLFAAAIGLPQRLAVPLLSAALLALAALGTAVRLPEPLGFWTSPLLLEFLFGLALGHLHARGAALGAAARSALALAGLALLAADFTRPGSVLEAPRFLAWGLPSALLVAAAALGRERVSRAGPAGRLGVAIGDASYALYLLHPFAIRGVLSLTAASGLGAALGPAGFIVVSLSAAVLASLVAHRLFERPATEWARRRLSALLVRS